MMASRSPSPSKSAKVGVLLPELVEIPDTKDTDPFSAPTMMSI